MIRLLPELKVGFFWKFWQKISKKTHFFQKKLKKKNSRKKPNLENSETVSATLKVAKSNNIVEIGQSAHFGTCKVRNIDFFEKMGFLKIK